MTIKDVVDIVKRRCRFLLKDNTVETVFATIKDNEVNLIFKLASDLDTDDLTKQAIKFKHVFEDMENFTTVTKNKSEYITQTRFMWIVWSNKSGYILN